MVYYQDESIDIVYTRDLIQFLQSPGRYLNPKDLPILEHIKPARDGSKNKYDLIAQAKTQ